MNKNLVILLTATINPNGMSFTQLQDPNIRLDQYIQAINFYLNETSYKIVFVENSGIDISYIFTKAINAGRVEILSFLGNDYNKSRGKGLGEARIIEYALEHSIFISNCTHIIKITGRLIVPNINRVLTHLNFKLNADLQVDFHFRNMPKTMFFVCTKSWIQNIYDYEKYIDDSNGFYFEHMIYKMMLEIPKSNVLPFLNIPLINGVSGTANCPYNNKKTKIAIVDNLDAFSQYYLTCGNRLLYIIFRLFYCLVVLVCKFCII